MTKTAIQSSGRSSATREKILSAARDLFAKRGFKGTTTAAIAQKAEVNEALIYRHFPGKKDLYTAILNERVRGFEQAGLFRWEDFSALPLRPAMEMLIQRFHKSHDPVFFRLFYQSALEGHPLASEFRDAFIIRVAGVIEKIVRQAIAKGEAMTDDPQAVAEAILAILRSHYLMQEIFSATKTAQKKASLERTHKALDIILRGLEPERKAAKQAHRPR